MIDGEDVKLSADKKRAILDACKKRLGVGIDAERLAHQYAMDDLKNVAGFQYPDEIREAREKAAQVCLTSNRLPQFVRQVTGDIRQMNPAIKILPSDSAASKGKAEVLEGLLRQIQYRSDASSVFERAAESAAQCSMGFFRILADYEADDSFDQELLIKFIPNPFSVIFDPNARHPTRCDAEWCFISEWMTKEDFEAEYPDAKSTSNVDAPVEDKSPYWLNGGEVRVAEYFWIEKRPVRLVQLVDGRTVMEPGAEIVAPMIAQERKTTKKVVMWAKVGGAEILDDPRELPGEYIPVIAVIGEEFFIGDQYYRSSVIRHAKDDQRMLNYSLSSQTEVVALQPKAPFVVTGKQIAGQETMWGTAGRTSLPYLLYTPDEKAPGPPQRQIPPQPSAGMNLLMQQAIEGLQATTGIYNAALGQRSNEASGRAINARKIESDVATSIYSDNMAKAIEQCGRVLLSWIPKIYDTQRAVQLVTKDGETQPGMINVPYFDGAQPGTMNDLTTGRYDVRVVVGPNFASRKQETADSMMQFVQAVPQAGAFVSDLIAKNMEWPGAEEIAERLKKMLPPGLADDEYQQPDPMQAQAMQAQQRDMQMQQQVQGALAEAQVRKANAEAEEAAAQAEEAKAKVIEAQAKAQLAMMQLRQPMAQPQGQPAI